jgi:autotransporter-associated beta strand protein
MVPGLLGFSPGLDGPGDCSGRIAAWINRPVGVGCFHLEGREGMRRSTRIVLIALVLVSRSAMPQDTVLDFSLVDVPNEPVPSVAATTVVNGLTALELTRGPGLTIFNLTRGFSAQSWITGLEPGIPASRETAIEYGDYFQFGLTVNPDATASLSTLDISLRRSAIAAPSNLEWQYSFDSFASPGVTISDPLSPWYSTGVFTYLGRNSGSGGVAVDYNYMVEDVSAQGTGNPMPPLDLSGIEALQNIPGGSNLTFRLYGWGNGTGSDTNTLAIGRDAGPKLTGTVVAPPPPGGILRWASDGVSAGGTGTWNDTGFTWLDDGGSASPWVSASTAVFGGVGADVFVESAVTVEKGLRFETDGYQLKNGTITLAGGDAATNTIEVASTTIATIEAAVAGTSGWTKTGPGRLVLSAANSISGAATITAGIVEVMHPGGLGGTNVTVAAGGRLALPGDRRINAAVSGLSIEAGPGGGLVDLEGGQLSIAAGGITASDLRASLIAGRNGGTWNGSTGITSTTAATSGGTRGVGYVVAGDGSASVSFAAAGDVDLSGQVNVFDLVAINSSGKYGTGSASVWSQGDFNYDGSTNVFDLVGVNTAGAYGQGNYFPAAQTAGTFAKVTAVPEPATWALGMAAIGAVRLLRRRIP